MGGYLLRDGFMAAPKLAPFFWTKPGIGPNDMRNHGRNWK